MARSQAEKLTKNMDKVGGGRSLEKLGGMRRGGLGHLSIA